MPENHMQKNYSPESLSPDHGGSAPTELARRRRYARSPSQAVLTPLTPTRVEMLRYLAELRFLSLPHIARLCCPSSRQDLSQKSARRHMRALFDAGLVDVLPVSRAALAPPDVLNDASLLYGSAPNVYALTACGLETLHRAGLADRQEVSRKKPTYGPKNSLFLAHELAVRDVRVWLECFSKNREGALRVLHWRHGPDAVIELGRYKSSQQVRPDAWFVLRLTHGDNPTVLVGLIEVDRGTERGNRHWQKKLVAYEALFAGDRLRETTGYRNARVLVTTLGEVRRDGLATCLASGASSALASRFWLTTQAALDQDGLTDQTWRVPGRLELLPLIPTSLMP